MTPIVQNHISRAFVQESKVRILKDVPVSSWYSDLLFYQWEMIFSQACACFISNIFPLKVTVSKNFPTVSSLICTDELVYQKIDIFLDF